MCWVVIVGVLVMDLEVFVLDELIVGLDFYGCEEIMEMFYNFYKEKGFMIVFVIYSMEDVVCYVEKIVLMKVGMVF